MKKILIILLLFCSTGLGQDYARPYPRIFGIYFAQTPGMLTPYIVAKNDMVQFWGRESNYVALYRALNADIIVVQTSDWNRGQLFMDNGASINDLSVWYMVNEDGDWVIGYNKAAYPYQMDPTDSCPKWTGTLGGFPIANERYNDALIRILPVVSNQFDGINSDGCWPQPWGATDGVDWDRDGINDNPSGIVRTQMLLGWAKIATGLVNAGFKTSVNYGGGLSSDISTADEFNGRMWESGMTRNDPWTYAVARGGLEAWDTISTTLPRINAITYDVVQDAAVNSPDNRCYKAMRWYLGIALLHGWYFQLGGSNDTRGDGGSGYGHQWGWFYDEYNLNLGQPIGRNVAINSHSGCYARAYDSGLVIVNTSNIDHTITLENLAASSITGYDPPYYCFYGSQDAGWNNGAEYSSKIFTTRAFSSPQHIGSQLLGDAVILVKRPSIYAIEELIVDNTYPATTPGQDTCQRSGTWSYTNDTSSYSGFRGRGQVSTANNITFWYATAGSGAYADHQATININGDYNVYEWHGYRGGVDSNNSASVPHIVSHADGVDTFYVNQKINGGQKNLLGKFRYQSGGARNVRVTTVGATTGSVVDDAIFWEFVPPEYVTDAPKKAMIKKTVWFDNYWWLKDTTMIHLAKKYNAVYIDNYTLVWDRDINLLREIN